MNINLTVLEIKNVEEAERVIAAIGCDSRGVQIMKSKAVFRVIKIEHIRSKAANLLKQAFLSKGAEVAVGKGAADLSAEYTDALIMATVRQYRQAALNLKMQPWGLPRLAEQIEALIGDTGSALRRTYQWADRTFSVGETGNSVIGAIDIVAAEYKQENIVGSVERLQREGADAIELLTEGCLRAVAPEKELTRLLPLLRTVLLHCSLPVMIRTGSARIAEKSLICGAHMIDLPHGFTGDSAMAGIIAKYNVPVVISMDAGQISSSAYFMEEIQHFLQKNINIGRQAGIDSNQIVLAPFGSFLKHVENAFWMIENIEQIKGFGCPILINFAEAAYEVTSFLSLKECRETLLSAVVLGKMKGIQIFGGREIGEIKSLLNTLDKIRRVEKNDENFN